MIPRAQKLTILGVLYFIQGLPYGFQLIALPVYLRQAGLSLTSIGLASALGLPWLFKVLWGPAVDRWTTARWGRRRSWILPLQLALASVCAAAAFAEPAENLRTLLLLVFAMNLLASIMDVAVDGLAIDVLTREELGYGNITQVVGYKVGMLTGGGLLVTASEHLGWHGLFLSMACLVVVAFAITLRFREPHRADADLVPQASVVSILRSLGTALRRPGSVWLLVFVATYKLGETLADSMFRPFLFDHGYTVAEIGVWLGSWGLAVSLAGSFLGGVLASRIGLWPALAITATLRAMAVAGEWWLSLVEPTQARVIVVIAAEQGFGGMLTTALFAYMMSTVDRQIGATHFSALATVEVGGKLLAGSISGWLADLWGYSTLFGVATVLSVAFLGLLWPLAAGRRLTGDSPAADTPGAA